MNEHAERRMNMHKFSDVDGLCERRRRTGGLVFTQIDEER